MSTMSKEFEDACLSIMSERYGLDPWKAPGPKPMGWNAAAPNGHFAATAIGLDRLVRKEDSLGSIREILPPMDHIGLEMFPLYGVESDDVIFDYIKNNLADGLSPARAEDAESELSQKDDFTYTQGRASI